MSVLLLSLLPLGCAALYCVVRAVSDLRARRYGWAIFGMISATAILTLPVPTHAVKIDLPPSTQTK